MVELGRTIQSCTQHKTLSQDTHNHPRGIIQKTHTPTIPKTGDTANRENMAINTADQNPHDRGDNY